MGVIRACSIITVAAGASDVVPAQGGSISFEGPKFSSYFGVGDLGGVFGMGTYVKTTIGSHPVTLGDQPIIFDLPRTSSTPIITF